MANRFIAQQHKFININNNRFHTPQTTHYYKQSPRLKFKECRVVILSYSVSHKMEM